MIFYFFSLCVIFPNFISSCNVTTKINKHNFSLYQNHVIAHRGAWKKNNLPQNSIQSLNQSIEMKYAGSEFDVRMTSDDSLIVIHDPIHGGLDVEKNDYNTLSKILLSNGETLPTLRDYFLFWKKRNTSTHLICEIKPSESSQERSMIIAKKVIDLEEELKLKYGVDYISFDYQIIKYVAQRKPNSITQYLGGDKTPKELKTDNIKGLDYNISIYKNNPSWIKDSKNLGLYLNVWTVNDFSTMNWLLDQGFDLITTDEPELLSNIRN